jgi:hypothetical protein
VAPGDDAWTAPEDAVKPSTASDVYSAALVALYAATGELLQDRSEDALRAPATTLAQRIGASVDARLDLPLSRALSADPSRRYKKVSELAAAIAQALNGPPRAAPVAVAVPTAMAAPVGLEPTYDTDPPQGTELAHDTEPPQGTELAHDTEPPQGTEPPFIEDLAIEDVQSIPNQPAGWASHAAPLAPDPSVRGSNPLASSPFTADAVNTNSMPVPVPPMRGNLALVAAIAVPVLVVSVLVAVLFLRPSKKPVDASAVSVSASALAAASASAVAAKDSTPEPAPTAAPIAEAPVANAPASAAPAAPPVKSGELTVKCTPACSDITVDGESISSFPATVPAGAHTVVAQRGSKAQTRRVTVRSGRTETISIAWQAAAAPPPAKKRCGKFLQRCD